MSNSNGQTLKTAPPRESLSNLSSNKYFSSSEAHNSVTDLNYKITRLFQIINKHNLGSVQNMSKKPQQTCSHLSLMSDLLPDPPRITTESLDALTCDDEKELTII